MRIRFFTRNDQVWEDGAADDGGDLLLCEAKTIKIATTIASKLNSFDGLMTAIKHIGTDTEIAVAKFKVTE